MNNWMVLIGAAGLIGLMIAVLIAAGMRGVFDGWLAPTDEDEFRE